MNDHSKRREFLKNLGIAAAPLLVGTSAYSITPGTVQSNGNASVNFISDGLWMNPEQYVDKLQQLGKSQGIARDFYGNGGVTQQLEADFAQLTGKEKAIYLPTGTMANQLAIKLLNGHNTKVIVPENSHVFRDEADAAQSVHNKRLIPVGKGKPFFDVDDLKQVIQYTNNGEVFRSGLGTVLIESPVRRADGAAIPLDELKELTKYCREQGYKLHLDGARIHLATAFTGVSVKEYSSLFDTVYVSLYKYLNAAGGAMLCGPAELIDQVGHQIKIHGGTLFQTWTNTAMAHHYLKGIEARWEEVRTRFDSFSKAINDIKGVTLSPIKNGTNIFDLKLDKSISSGKFSGTLAGKHQMLVRQADRSGVVKLSINESLLDRPVDRIIEIWGDVIEASRA